MNKRTFIAIDIKPGNNFFDVFYELKEQLKAHKIKWVDPKNIHLTLKFIGDIKENKIKGIIEAMEDSFKKVEAFDIQLKNIGFFGKITDPKVLWAGIEENKQLFEVQRILESNLFELGIAKENRKFKPHLTLGRIKEIVNTNEFEHIMEDFNNEIDEILGVTEVVLYESKLTSQGPIYSKLHPCILA